MSGENELGVFLRTRRERVQPAEVGLPRGGGMRRTPGLRREELAALAGVSVDYYTRLERGRESRPSASVLDSLAGVLRLDDAEKEHLRALAARAARARSAAAPRSCRTARPTALLLLESLRPNPAYVVNRTNHLVAANPGGLAVFHGITDWPAEQRNLTRYLFLHAAARGLWEDWERLASGSVAHLRAVAGAEPDDPDLAALVGELLVKSDDFARMWNRYEVKPRTFGVKAFRHPLVGRMRLEYESLVLSGSRGQRIVTYLAAPGSPDHDAMVLLDMIGAGQEHPEPAAQQPADSCQARNR